MSISYDPDKSPKVSAELMQFARSENMHIANIICSEEKEDETEESSVSFLTAVAFIPREGERLVLEDGKQCVVTSVLYGVSSKGKHRILMPNVYATVIYDDHHDDE